MENKILDINKLNVVCNLPNHTIMGVTKRLKEMQMKFAHEIESNEGRKNSTESAASAGYAVCAIYALLPIRGTVRNTAPQEGG